MLLIFFCHDIVDLALSILGVNLVSDRHHRHELFHQLALRANFKRLRSMCRFQDQVNLVLRLISRHVPPKPLVVESLCLANVLDFAALVCSH